MGFVFVGEHTLLGRRAAIKTLQPTMSANHEVAERFFNEARAISAISDPGVIQIFDFGYHVDGTAYLVMELLEGETLANRIDQLGRLPLGHALRIARQIAGSLAAAHARDIVHRDLKPENVFLVRDPEAEGGERTKILDFGICKVGTQHAALTQAGTMIGTPVYMSPEQCRGAGEVDHRSDIYAFGCLMFHMITGRPPFLGEAPGELIAAHLREDPPPASRYVLELPVAIDAVLARCLAKSPADRFASMTELQDVIGELCVQADGSWPAGPDAPPALPRRGSHAGAEIAAEIVAWRGGNTSSPTHPLCPRPRSTPLNAATAPAQAPALVVMPEPPPARLPPAPLLGRPRHPPLPLPAPDVCDRLPPPPMATATPGDWFAPPTATAPRDRFTPARAVTSAPNPQRSLRSLTAELDEAISMLPSAGVPAAEIDEATSKLPSARLPAVEPGEPTSTPRSARFSAAEVHEATSKLPSARLSATELHEATGKPPSAGSTAAEFDEATVKQRPAAAPAAELEQPTTKPPSARTLAAEFDEATIRQRPAAAPAAELDESTGKPRPGDAPAIKQPPATSPAAEIEQPTTKPPSARYPAAEIEQPTTKPPSARHPAAEIEQPTTKPPSARYPAAEIEQPTIKPRSARYPAAEIEQPTIKPRSARHPAAELEEATINRPRPSTASPLLPSTRSHRAAVMARDGFTPPRAMAAVPSELLSLESSAWLREADLEEATIQRPRPSTAERQLAALRGRARVRRSRWSALANLLVLSSVLGLFATSLDDGGATAAIPAIADGTLAAPASRLPAAVAPAPAHVPAATPGIVELSRPRDQDLVDVAPLQPGEPAADADAPSAAPAATDAPGALPAPALSVPARDPAHRDKPPMAKPRAQLPRQHPAAPRRQRL